MVGICSEVSVKQLLAIQKGYIIQIGDSNSITKEYNGCALHHPHLLQKIDKSFFSVAPNQTTWLTNHSKSNYAKASKMTWQTHFSQNQKSMLININRHAKLSLLFILNQHRFNFTCTHTGKLYKGKKETKKTYLR